MLISCVMLTTKSRSRLRSAALAALRDQTETPRFEVIVVGDEDDETLTTRDVMRATGHKPIQVVTYKRPTWASLSDKRNTACDLAAGDWITFWDDDDWSAPTRLHDTVNVIKTHGAEIVGVRSILWHELCSTMRRTVEYVSPDPGYVVGGTLAFKKALWKKASFKDQPGDEGWWTLDRYKDGARLFPTWYPYVAMVHGGNVANRKEFRVNELTGEVHDGAEFKLRRGDRNVVLEVMGKEALEQFEAAVA